MQSRRSPPPPLFAPTRRPFPRGTAPPSPRYDGDAAPDVPILFNSIPFLVYFPVVGGLYFLLPDRWRWVHLLAASYAFYMLVHCWHLLPMIQI